MFKQLKRPLILITFAILLFVLVTNFAQVLRAAGWFFGLFGPFIIGVVIAFILNRPYNFFRFKLFRKLGKPDGKNTEAMRKVFALLLVYLIFGAVIVLLLFAVLPQLVESIQKLANNFESYSRSLETMLNGWLDVFGIRSYVWEQIDTVWQDFTAGLGKMLTNDIVPYLISAVGGIATGISNFLIGLVASIYFLAGKEKLIAQLKRLFRAILPSALRTKLNRIWALSNRMFGEFIVGQIANAAVVGVLCFIGMSILRMDYALMISVLVCVANIIPFFGCIIGAVPSAFILLMVDPMQALWFIIFITLLQAVDGNIICPKIVGESVGLSGLWVMVSIVVGGSLFGVPGMFLGVPAFAVLYALLRDFTVAREHTLSERAAVDGEGGSPDADVPDSVIDPIFTRSASQSLKHENNTRHAEDARDKPRRPKR